MKNSNLRFGSVCSGIEAASVAWEPLGWKAAWLSEIEPFPSAVLAHHYPDVPNLGDMTALPDRIRSGEIEAPDIFCGGTPCQAFSVAGLRKSLDDARGNLSLIFCEIANAIDLVRHAAGQQPSVVFWENVPGVLSTKDNAFGCFLGALAGEDSELQPPGGKWSNAGCVFGPQRAVAWRILDAQYFGVAQRRRRVFVVASARDGFDPTAVLFEFESLRRDSAPSREAGQSTTHDVAPSLVRSGRGVERIGETRGQDPCSWIEHTGPLDTDGSTQAVMSAYGFQPRIARNGRGDMGDLVSALNAQSGETGKGDAAPCVVIAFDTTQVTSKENRSNPKPSDPCHPLSAGAHAPTIVFQDRFRGDDGRGYDRPPPVSVDQVGTLETVKPWNIATDDCSCPARDKSTAIAVRRFTPRECERLQGFPDDYTLISYGRAIRPEKLDADWIKYLMRGGVMTREECARAAADGPRYKALGNSWAVPNVRWIGKRIDAALREAE